MWCDLTYTSVTRHVAGYNCSDHSIWITNRSIMVSHSLAIWLWSSDAPLSLSLSLSYITCTVKMYPESMMDIWRCFSRAEVQFLCFSDTFNMITFIVVHTVAVEYYMNYTFFMKHTRFSLPDTLLSRRLVFASAWKLTAVTRFFKRTTGCEAASVTTHILSIIKTIQTNYSLYDCMIDKLYISTIQKLCYNYQIHFNITLILS